MKRALNIFGKLLAVIAIILLVAFIVFPIFPRQCHHPRVFTCESNEKQLGLAILQYAQDNDETFPNIAAAPNSSNTWRVAISRYTRKKGIYQCPSRDDKSDGPDGFPQSYAANYTGNYSGSKSDLGDGVFGGPGSQGVKLRDIPDPSSLIALCEVSHHSTPDFNIDNIAAFNPRNHTLWAGHVGGSNYLMVDCHVKYYRPLGTKDKWHRRASVPLTPAAIALLTAAQSRAGK